MEATNNFKKHLTTGANRWYKLTHEQKISLPIVWSDNKAQNFIKCIDYLEGINQDEFNALQNESI